MTNAFKKSLISIFAVFTLLFSVICVTPAHADTLIVTNNNDSGAGSLRQMIINASAGDTITFDPLLAGQTITLASNLIIGKDLTIDGSGLSPQLTISGGNVAHLEIPFSLSIEPIVTISDLAISNGYTSDSGGAIYSWGNLTVINSTLINNHALGAGGAIFGTRLTLQNTTISQNRAGAGGAIYLVG